MEHREFVEKWLSGQIDVTIDKNLAGHLFGERLVIPHKYRLQQASLRTLAFGITISSIAMFFFVAWYLALMGLVIGLALFPLCQKHAMKSVFKASLEKPAVLVAALERGVLVVSEKKSQQRR